MFENLKKMIENIEDNLSKYCEELQSILERATKGGKTGFIFTPMDKSYPMNISLDEIINDPDNIYIPEATLANVELSKFQEERCLDKFVRAQQTIQDIKNSIISIGYENPEMSKKIVNERLKNKIPELHSIRDALDNNVIGNHKIKNIKRDLIKYINKLFHEIESVSNNLDGGRSRQIQLAPNVSKWLQETVCYKNDKSFIEKAVNNYAWNWLQPKDLARLLLTHPKINITGLKGKELKQKISETFFYPKENKPLRLAKQKKQEVTSKDYDTLSDFLATL